MWVRSDVKNNLFLFLLLVLAFAGSPCFAGEEKNSEKDKDASVMIIDGNVVIGSIVNEGGTRENVTQTIQKKGLVINGKEYSEEKEEKEPASR